MTSVKRPLIHTFSMNWFTFHTWPLCLPTLPHSYPLDEPPPTPVSSCVSRAKGLNLGEKSHCPALISFVLFSSDKAKRKMLHLLVNLDKTREQERSLWYRSSEFILLILWWFQVKDGRVGFTAHKWRKRSWVCMHNTGPHHIYTANRLGSFLPTYPLKLE